MSTENDDLFEGLQIMSAAELNTAVAAEKGEEPISNESAGETPEFEIVPVAAESGDDDNRPAPVIRETTETTESSDSNEDRSSTIYKALMKELVKEGVITAEEAELEELPGSLDAIKQLVNKTVDTHFKHKEQNWKNSLSPEKKRFLEIEDAFDEAGYAIEMAQKLEFFDNVTEEDIEADENLAKQIYFEQLKAKNFSDSEAIEAIEDAVAIGKLKDKAIKAVPELRNYANEVVEQSRMQKIQQTKAQQEAQTKAFEQLLSNIDSRDAFIDGLNLNKISKDKLKSNIINPVYKDQKTGREYNSLSYKQAKNPVEFEMLINYYDTLGLFNIDKAGKFKPDISKLKSVAKTAAINELDKVIAAEDQRGVGRNTSVESSKKTEGILNMLDKAFKVK
jgi:hypothetical protein